VLTLTATRCRSVLIQPVAGEARAEGAEEGLAGLLLLAVLARAHEAVGEVDAVVGEAQRPHHAVAVEQVPVA